MSEEKLTEGLDLHHENKWFRETKNKLDKVGCGFCLAKWTQSYTTITNRIHIHATIQKHTKYLLRKYQEIHQHFIILFLRKEEEKKCWKVKDLKSVIIVGM